MRRPWLCSVGVLVALMVVLPRGPAGEASESSSPVRLVGTLDRHSADVARALGMSVAELREAGGIWRWTNGRGIVFPSERTLFQIYVIESGGFVETVVAKRDLGTLRLLGLKVFERLQATTATTTYSGDWFHALDEVHGRLFLAFGGSDPQGFLSIDVKTLRTIKLTIPAFATYRPIRLGGIAYDPLTDRLWGIANLGNAADPSGTVSMNGLVAWPATFSSNTMLPDPELRMVRACRGLLLTFGGGPFATPVMRERVPDLEDGGKMKDFFIFPCGSGGAGVAIVRIEAPMAFDPRTPEKVVLGPTSTNIALLDEGAGRLFLVNQSANVSAWVYEAQSNAIIGVVAVSRLGDQSANFIGLGVDSMTGRLYGLGQELGLFFSDMRFDPVPQAQSFPLFKGRGRQRILVDSERSHVFVLRGENTPADRYEIYAVRRPLPPPPPEDPDRNTVQVREREGLTRANYGGGASAYGVRVLLAGGVRGMAPVGPQSGSNSALGFVYQSAESKCGPTNRELVLASVRDTSLSLASYGASALAVSLDPSTIADLKNPSRCDVFYRGGVLNTPPFEGLFATLGREAAQAFDDLAGSDWEYGEANCQRRGGEDVGDETVSKIGDASVDCSDEEISATAEAEVSKPIGTTIRIGRAETTTTVYLDPKRGLVSHAESTVTGIRIGDVSIFQIRSVAESWAKGFHRTAGASRAVTLSGVEAPGFSCDECPDIEAVRTRLNDALSGRVEIRNGAPDPRLKAGTPGGYQAAIIKNDKQVSSDNALTGDSSREVPAFEILVYNDSPELGRSRQLYQFAGVATDSRYGIELIPKGLGLLPVGSVGFLAPLPGSVAPTPLLHAQVHAPASGAGTFPSIPGIIRGVTKGIGLFVSHPGQALALSTAWILLGAPFAAARRRRLLIASTETVDVAER